MMDYYADTQSFSDVDIEKVERVTRGQSNNEVWRLKRDKLTASNFQDAAVSRKEPDKFLRNIKYVSQINTERNTQINEADPEIAMNNADTQRVLFLLSQTIQDYHNYHALQQLEYK